jgi:enamine deaminase RidA (YjgF/YER057c/UK114 family)
MPKKEIVQVQAAAANPNLSLATKFGNLVFVSGQTGRHPVSGEVGKDIREQTATSWSASRRSWAPPARRSRT